MYHQKVAFLTYADGSWAVGVRDTSLPWFVYSTVMNRVAAATFRPCNWALEKLSVKNSNEWPETYDSIADAVELHSGSWRSRLADSVFNIYQELGAPPGWRGAQRRYRTVYIPITEDQARELSLEVRDWFNEANGYLVDADNRAREADRALLDSTEFKESLTQHRQGEGVVKVPRPTDEEVERYLRNQQKSN